jgi:hypothetical protein
VSEFASGAASAGGGTGFGAGAAFGGGGALGVAGAGALTLGVVLAAGGSTAALAGAEGAGAGSAGGGVCAWAAEEKYSEERSAVRSVLGFAIVAARSAIAAPAQFALISADFLRAGTRVRTLDRGRSDRAPGKASSSMVAWPSARHVRSRLRKRLVTQECPAGRILRLGLAHARSS